MNQDPNHGAGDPADIDAPDHQPPAEDKSSRNVPIARQPMEQIGRAMQVQSELLKQMHERQRMLEDVVKDNRRHDLMINSAQALNESFQGLQRVQERLADRLDDSSGSSRGRFAILSIALLLLVAVGGLLTWRIMEGSDTLNTNLKAALDPSSRDRELLEDLAKLETRVLHVEEADRAAFRDEIEKLRKGFGEKTAENEKLREERDKANQDLGAAKATLGTAQTEAVDLRGKTQTLEKENARLTAQGVADQKTVTQLNDVIAMMKDTRSPAVPKESDGDAPKEPGRPPPRVNDRTPSPASSGAPEPSTEARTEADVAGAGGDAVMPFPAAQLDTLNALLKTHRGSDRYEFKRVEKTGQKKLWNVAMEVRGVDGNLAKTIDADSVTFWIKGDLLEIEFQGGSVTFHQGIGGKSTKSPFFNDRYLIVVLGANGKEWLAANQPFVRPK